MDTKRATAYLRSEDLRAGYREDIRRFVAKDLTELITSEKAEVLRAFYGALRCKKDRQVLIFILYIFVILDSIDGLSGE